MAKLSAQTTQTIQSHLDSATSNTGLPGLVFCAIDKSGSWLTQQATGQRGLTNSTPMDADSVFWLASCTKLVTGIACMQLVEQGQAHLDSAEWLYGVCPELHEKKVLESSGKLVDRKGEITLRMLLAHTAGFGYAFFNERLNEHGRPTGWDEFSGDGKDVLGQPLVNQPGERWEYGVNIDWAGQVVERVSGMTLDGFFKKNIFEPLGLKDLSCFPTKSMRENLVSMSQREKDGSARDSDHLQRRPIFLADEQDVSKKIFNSGGAGLFGKPVEYCQILTTLLNDGVSPSTKNRILQASTVSQMFQNQIPQFPQFGRQGIPDAKPNLTNPLPDLYPQPGNPDQGWGLTFMLTKDPEGKMRGENTAWWAGLPNLFWWCDREKGVAGMIAGQILPHADVNILNAWVNAETALYEGLAATK
ncbi:MAG: hypothetical protein M1831_003649 [Alyxoria varia]|nr:MAG: hypothetical protein M1831_003649 [Alyxoria varia]